VDRFANPEVLRKAKVEKIKEMGFTAEQAIKALKENNEDEYQAIQSLLNS
jgi:NACalpha-BTF3-like transcription factor